MVAVFRAGFPAGLLLGESVGHDVPLERGAQRQGLAYRRKARLMAEQITNGERLLARLRELRPVVRDRCIEVQQALVDEPVHAGRRDALVVDQTLTIVSRSHGFVRSGPMWPAQRSTTAAPSTTTEIEAPTSP